MRRKRKEGADPRPRHLVIFDPKDWAPGSAKDRRDRWRAARRTEWDAGNWPDVTPLQFVTEQTDAPNTLRTPVPNPLNDVRDWRTLAAEQAGHTP